MIHRHLRYVAITYVLLLTGCASIGRPTVTQIIPDPPLFLVTYPLAFSAGNGQQQFSVPSGFVTDLASIPKTLWWWQGPHVGTMAPAIVHDFLYWEQPCTKDEADAVIYVAMKQTGMKDRSISLVYAGVRTPIGQVAWNKNKAARTRGEARFFTSTFSSLLVSSNVDPKATLATIQADATKKNGVTIPSLPLATIKAVCQAAVKEFESLQAL